MSRPLCGECPACLEATRLLLGASPRRCLQARPAPTAAELERHASRFGPEGVAETAAELGVDVTVESPGRRRGPRGPSLKTRVAALVADGHGVDVVADVENLTPGRARRLVDSL